MLKLRAVDFAYGAQPVLRGITIDLPPGEITCLLGASGCGKTTLLQLCAGLLHPSGGTIESGIARPGPAIGYMPQQNSLLPWRNVRDNLVLGPQLLGRAVTENEIDKALAQVGLRDKKQALPGELSGGQQQRVALAQQLILKPQLLLLDEPLGALDVVLRQELAQLIRQLVREEGMAALVVTHQPDDALFLADRLCLLGGRPARLVREWQIAEETPDFDDIITAMRFAA